MTTELTDDDARELAGLQASHARAMAARETTLEARDAALEKHKRAGVPVTHLADAVGMNRGYVHEILRKRGVPADRAGTGGDRSNLAPAPAYRIRRALQTLGFDPEASPAELGDAVRDQLATDPPQ